MNLIDSTLENLFRRRFSDCGINSIHESSLQLTPATSWIRPRRVRQSSAPEADMHYCTLQIKKSKRSSKKISRAPRFVGERRSVSATWFWTSRRSQTPRRAYAPTVAVMVLADTRNASRCLATTLSAEPVVRTGRNEPWRQSPACRPTCVLTRWRSTMPLTSVRQTGC